LEPATPTPTHHGRNELLQKMLLGYLVGAYGLQDLTPVISVKESLGLLRL